MWLQMFVLMTNVKDIRLLLVKHSLISTRFKDFSHKRKRIQLCRTMSKRGW